MNCFECGTDLEPLFWNMPKIEEDGDTIKRVLPFWCPQCKQHFTRTEWFYMTDCSWSR